MNTETNEMNKSVKKELTDIYKELSNIDKEIANLMSKRALLEQQISLIYIQRYNSDCQAVAEGTNTTTTEVVTALPIKSSDADDLSNLFDDDAKNIVNSEPSEVVEDDPFAELNGIFDEPKVSIDIQALKKLTNELVMKGLSDQVKAVFISYGIKAVKHTPEHLISDVYSELSNLAS